MELVHVERAHRVVLGQPGEVDDLRALGRHLERGLLRLLGRRGDAHPVCPRTAGLREHLADAVVLAGHERLVDERADDAHRQVEPVLLHVGHVDAARAPIPAHDRLPAPDRPGAEDHHDVAQADVEHLDAVERAGERVGDGREIGREIVGQRDQVLRRDRRHRRPLGVRPGEGVVPVQQVVLAQVLEPLHTPPALAAREDRAEEHAVALGDAGREHRLGPHLREHADGLVAEHPRRGGPRVAVEERPRVRAADPARLDPQDRAARVELGLLGLAHLDRVHVGHERGPHRDDSSLGGTVGVLTVRAPRRARRGPSRRSTARGSRGRAHG